MFCKEIGYDSRLVDIKIRDALIEAFLNAMFDISLNILCKQILALNHKMSLMERCEYSYEGHYSELNELIFILT